MAGPRFRQLAHTADVRLAVWGDDEDEIIANAVAGVMCVAMGRNSTAQPRDWAPVEPWRGDLSWRLVRAANEALFQLFTRRRRAVAFRSTTDAAQLGLTPLPRTAAPQVEIKAATFHDLHPRREAGRLSAVLTLDV